ncbi:hypothetical protein O6H91_23G033200 [Diphasiastrum complanatum]|uniref:Uncharacterized protein n=1 Tax=Diphasiastrum complanatum TaxID=34168 RepID=A0ACC2A9L1_DIPCM|nr:hypothetical protein O6H91_23G033200 [Diphasiastrum complanatum]
MAGYSLCRALLSANRWARNRFNDWRVVMDLDPCLSIEDLFLSDLNRLLELLVGFFLQVQRKDGSLYPGETLVNMLRGIGRIIRARLELNTLSSGIVVEEFNIMLDPRFKKVRVSCLTAVQRSSVAGVGRKRKLTQSLTVLQVQSILSQAFMQCDDGHGVLMRLAFYICRNFCVRGHLELYNLCISDFEICCDHMGTFVRFDERCSKNHKVDLAHCKPERMRQPVSCYLPDVVSSFEVYFAHLPKWDDDDGCLHPFFLRAIDGVRQNPVVISLIAIVY